MTDRRTITELLHKACYQRGREIIQHADIEDEGDYKWDRPEGSWSIKFNRNGHHEISDEGFTVLVMMIDASPMRLTIETGVWFECDQDIFQFDVKGDIRGLLDIISNMVKRGYISRADALDAIAADDDYDDQDLTLFKIKSA